MVVLIGVIVSVMCVFLLRMYTLAAVSPDERAVADADSMTYQTTVEGARGCIPVSYTHLTLPTIA